MNKAEIRKELSTYYMQEAYDEIDNIDTFHYTGVITNINGKTYEICMSSSNGYELYDGNECIIKCYNVYGFMQEVERILLRL